MPAQVYEKIFSRRYGNQVTIVTDGNYYLLKVPFVPWGYLTKTLVQQSAGVAVAFTIEVLNSNLGLTPGEITPSSLISSWQQHRVVNPLAATAGAQAQGFTPAGNPFRNVDGPDPVRSGASAAGLGAGFTDNQRYVYVLIRPNLGTGGNSQWEVAINAFQDVA